MITFDRLSFRYPETEQPVIADFSATIDPGHVILVRGPSGSGKSTLLRCLNGLVPHSSGGHFSGRVVVDGLDTRAAAPRQLGAHVGFVFQHPDAQFVLEDVESELAFGLENLGLSRPLMRKRVEEVLDQVGIAGLRHRAIRTLSGGERQRVAIAATLVTHPSVLALDEPTSQLDPQAAEDVLHVLARLVSELGLTVVIAEHRVERIAPFVDRVFTLTAPGAPIADASPRIALGGGGARPPIVDLALRAGWDPVPITLGEARRSAAGLRATLGQAAAADRDSPRTSTAEVAGAAFSYNGTPALRDASLRLHGGEITVLMGRNGSGKTTLLKLLAGLLSPLRGRVTRQGTVAYVPQDADTLLYAATVQEEVKDHPESMLPLGVAEWLHRYPRDLSTGERQRVAIAAAAGRADVVLLDEPTRGLDPEAKRSLAAYLRVRADAGASILIATHDVEWAARAADRVALMSEGAVYAEGAPRAVLTDSLVFATQVNKLLGKGWLLPEEVPLPSPA